MKKFIIFTILLSQLIIMSVHAEENVDKENEENYYSETILISSEEMLHNSKFNEILNQSTNKSVEIDINNKYKVLSSGEILTPVLGKMKTVYVENKINMDGRISKGKLLTLEEKNEIDQVYEKKNNNDLKVNSSGLLPGSGQETPYNKLTLALAVYETSNGQFLVMGQADWEEYDKFNPTQSPDSHDDYIGLSWRVDSLKAIHNNAYGTYNDGSSISTAKKFSDDYGIFLWRFADLKGAGYYAEGADIISAGCRLDKYQAVQNKETSMRFTYIHTYDKFASEPVITVPGFGIPSIQLGNTTDSWQIEMSVPGLKY